MENRVIDGKFNGDNLVEEGESLEV